MTAPNQAKRGGFSQVAAAVAGVIVGAGVVAAGAVALKDKKNRQKVKQVLADAKDQAVEYMEEMQKDVQGKKSTVEKKLVDGQKEVKKEVMKKVEGR